MLFVTFNPLHFWTRCFFFSLDPIKLGALFVSNNIFFTGKSAFFTDIESNDKHIHKVWCRRLSVQKFIIYLIRLILQCCTTLHNTVIKSTVWYWHKTVLTSITYIIRLLWQLFYIKNSYFNLTHKCSCK
jgi:hypothetical protein